MLGGEVGVREDLENVGAALFTPSGQIFTFFIVKLLLFGNNLFYFALCYQL